MHDAGAMFVRRRSRALAAIAVAACVGGCAPENERSRIVTELPSEGYALFRVNGGDAKRVAFLVEMRDVDEGPVVLLYTAKAPESTGWFELDPDAFSPCRGYGEDAGKLAVDAGCLVPDGHGALVDVAVARGSLVVLRNEVPRASGYYAVMRVARTGDAVPIAVEVRSMDAVTPSIEPTVETVP